MPGPEALNIKIPYYVVEKGRGYWRPKKKMLALGFERTKCGPDGPMAWARAKELNERWQRVRRGEEPAPIAVLDQALTFEQAESAIIWPDKTIGWGFAEFRKTSVWKEKKPRTREEWWRAWRQIKPLYGDMYPSDITLVDVADLRDIVKDQISLREAHRTIKIWRALWQVLASLKLCNSEQDPSFGMQNEAAKGRTETWREGEVVRLVKHAWRTGHRGLAAALAVLWDSQMSPGDVVKLRRKQLFKNGQGALFFGQRQKTQVKVLGTLNRRATAVLASYVAGLGFDLHDETPIFYTAGFVPGPKGGRKYNPRPMNGEKFGKDFAKLRVEVFGKSEVRQLIDFRRSGAVEAIMGGSTRDELGKAMGNGIAKNDELWDTYVPVNTEMLAAHQTRRQIGRRILRMKNETGEKVPTLRSGQSQLLTGTDAKPLK